jgi:Tripartite tricarboxylate transporter family receptor
MTEERSKVLPNVPTGIEQGVPNFEAYTWNAIFLPKGAPAEMVNKLNRATVEAMESPNVRQRRLGVKSELPALPSLALGSAEVTLIEMTRAFGAIAANAESVEPYAIDSISRRSGRVCAAAVGAYARPQPGCAVMRHSTGTARCLCRTSRFPTTFSSSSVSLQRHTSPAMPPGRLAAPQRLAPPPRPALLSQLAPLPRLSPPARLTYRQAFLASYGMEMSRTKSG